MLESTDSSFLQDAAAAQQVQAQANAATTIQAHARPSPSCFPTPTGSEYRLMFLRGPPGEKEHGGEGRRRNVFFYSSSASPGRYVFSLRLLLPTSVVPSTGNQGSRRALKSLALRQVRNRTGGRRGQTWTAAESILLFWSRAETHILLGCGFAGIPPEPVMVHCLRLFCHPWLCASCCAGMWHFLTTQV